MTALLVDVEVGHLPVEGPLAPADLDAALSWNYAAVSTFVSTSMRLDAHMTPDSPIPFLLDSTRLAERLGITERHVRRLVSERRIPFVRVGRFIRFDSDEIAAWLASRSVEPAE